MLRHEKECPICILINCVISFDAMLDGFPVLKVKIAQRITQKLYQNSGLKPCRTSSRFLPTWPWNGQNTKTHEALITGRPINSITLEELMKITTQNRAGQNQMSKQINTDNPGNSTWWHSQALLEQNSDDLKKKNQFICEFRELGPAPSRELHGQLLSLLGLHSPVTPTLLSTLPRKLTRIGREAEWKEEQCILGVVGYKKEALCILGVVVPRNVY